MEYQPQPSTYLSTHDRHTKEKCHLDVYTKKNCFRSAKTLDKRILLFTNEDDPFGSIKGATKFDLIRTTLQRAKVGAFVYKCLIYVGFVCGIVLVESYMFLFSRMLKILAFQLNFSH